MTRRCDEGGTGNRDMAGTSWELIDESDVIGIASARLLSTCADRNQRLAALSLLGLLLDHADEAGSVRLPLDALARELDVESDRAVHLLHHLVAAEAVYAHGDAVVVAGTHAGEATLAPSRFLANLRTVLEREPTGSVPSRSVANGRLRGALAQPGFRSKRRVFVALGVAVAAMALATTPSGDPGSSLRAVGPAAPTGRAPWATVPVREPPPSVFAAEDGPTKTDDSGSTKNDESDSPTDDGPGSPGDDVPARSTNPQPPDGTSEVVEQPSNTVEAPSAPSSGPRRSEPSPSEPPPSVGRPADEPLPAGPPPAPSPPDSPTTLPEGGACPLGVPEAAVSATELLGAGPSNVLDVVGERLLLVTGTVVNASGAAVTVSTVEVGVGEGTDRTVVSVRPVPVAIPPGGTANWETTLMAGPTAQSQALVDATVSDWSWSDPDLAVACPS